MTAADAERLAAIRARHEVFEGIDGFDDLAGRIAADSAADVPTLLDALAKSNAELDAEKERADRHRKLSGQANYLLARIVAIANISAIEGDNGFITSYDMPVGPIHKAIPFLNEQGIVVTTDGRILNSPETINAALAGDQPEPTEEEWSERVQAARARARAKGYDDAHDREQGPTHLLMWAQDYLRRGRVDDAGGLIDSAMAVIMRPAALAGDQPEAEGSDLPNGHAPVEELSPFLHRRIQPEAAPLDSCGRGICALNDGHSGRCTT